MFSKKRFHNFRRIVTGRGTNSLIASLGNRKIVFKKQNTKQSLSKTICLRKFKMFFLVFSLLRLFSLYKSYKLDQLSHTNKSIQVVGRNSFRKKKQNEKKPLLKHFFTIQRRFLHPFMDRIKITVQ